MVLELEVIDCGRPAFASICATNRLHIEKRRQSCVPGEVTGGYCCVGSSADANWAAAKSAPRVMSPLSPECSRERMEKERRKQDGVTFIALFSGSLNS